MYSPEYESALQAIAGVESGAQPLEAQAASSLTGAVGGLADTKPALGLTNPNPNPLWVKPGPPFQYMLVFFWSGSAYGTLGTQPRNFGGQASLQFSCGWAGHH